VGELAAQKGPWWRSHYPVVRQIDANVGAKLDMPL